MLDLLENRGFTGAPRYPGRDQAGRDTFSFVPGWAPPKFRPWSDAQVTAAGTLARALHDATRSSDLAGQPQLVCHHVLGPDNAVFQDEMPVAFIDSDVAAPESPPEDVGYMFWLWCVSSKAGTPPVDVRATQVRVLADAHGLTGPERAGLVDAMPERQARKASFWAEAQAGLMAVEATDRQVSDHIAWSRREREHTSGYRKAFEDALK
ncbi:aminoglycoside phosphotransferase family protein [Streptomyces altiplanensis]